MKRGRKIIEDEGRKKGREMKEDEARKEEE
jgi:hypothetical protein